MVKNGMKLLFIGSLVFFAGCATAGRSPLTGVWYTNVQAGLAATPQVGPKYGEACASSILGIIATGDASIETARRNGGIASIASVDEKMSGILGFYATHCTIVRGK
jgi:hypothetical protein